MTRHEIPALRNYETEINSNKNIAQNQIESAIRRGLRKQIFFTFFLNDKCVGDLLWFLMKTVYKKIALVQGLYSFQ